MVGKRVGFKEKADRWIRGLSTLREEKSSRPGRKQNWPAVGG